MENMKKRVLQVYLFALTAIIPTYMPHGYRNLGEDKSICYFVISGLFAGILLFLFIKEKPVSTLFTRLILLNALFLAITFILSIDHKEALLGTNGWRIGFLTEALYLFFTYAFFRLDVVDEHFDFIVFTGPIIVVLFAVLQRMEMPEIADSIIINIPDFLSLDRSFISTIGNINWYCGFISVFFPLVSSLYVFRDNISWRKRGFYLLFFFLTSFSIMTQGANAIWLSIMVTLLFLFIYSIQSISTIKRYIHLLLLSGLSAEIIALVRINGNVFRPYNSSDVINKLLSLHIGAAVILLSVIIYLLLHLIRNESMKTTMCVISRKVFGISLVAFVLALIFILIWQFSTKFSNEWGSYRGIIYNVSTDLYREGTLTRRLFGAGNDCFYLYSTQFENISEAISSIYGDMRLTNAHSELLSLLITNGITGLTSYLLLLIAFFRKTYISAYAEQQSNISVISTACCITVLSCLAVSTVSFRHVLITPYVYVFMGMGAGVKNI